MAVRMWRLSSILYRYRLRYLARAIKGLTFLMFGAILPPEARVGRDLVLGHFGLGVVVHPNVTIGDGVRIWHRVTLAVDAPIGSRVRLTIEDDVVIGAGAVVITRADENLTIGAGSIVGANTVVTRSVPPGMVVTGRAGRPLHAVAHSATRRRRE